MIMYIYFITIYFYVNFTQLNILSCIFHLSQRKVFEASSYSDKFYLIEERFFTVHSLQNNPLLHEDWIVENDFAIDLTYL